MHLAWTIIILYRGRVALRRQGSHLRTSVELSLPIRTIIFGLYVAVGMRFVFNRLFYLFNMTCRLSPLV
jgi:hypothetical protein